MSRPRHYAKAAEQKREPVELPDDTEQLEGMDAEAEDDTNEDVPGTL
jgi:hypothetical protein